MSVKFLAKLQTFILFAGLYSDEGDAQVRVRDGADKHVEDLNNRIQTLTNDFEVVDEVHLSAEGIGLLIEDEKIFKLLTELSDNALALSQRLDDFLGRAGVIGMTAK